MDAQAIKIARRTRQEIERHKPELEKIGLSCYHDLCGLCAFASRVLALRLERAGFENVRIVQGNSDPKGPSHYATHVWIELNGEILDITATQFFHKRYPKVYVSKTPANFLFPTKRKGFSDWESGQRPNLKFIRAFEKMVDKEKKKS